MSTWTLSKGGVTKSLAEWGLSGLQIHFASLATDTASCVYVPKNVSTELPLAYKDTVKIYRDGTKVFEGIVIKPRESLTGTEHSVQFEMAGPWYWLARLPFTQQWYSGQTTNVLMFVSQNGNTVVHAADQIMEILQSAIDKGAPLAIGTLEPTDLWQPVEQRRSCKCEDAARFCLERAPFVGSWVDYSTDPPTIHFRHQSNLTAKTLTLGVDPFEINSIEPVGDQVSAVCLVFEKRGSVDGKPTYDLSVQCSPAAAWDTVNKRLHADYVLDAVQDTIDLAGVSLSNVMATLDCRLVNGKANAATLQDRVAWWFSGKRRAGMTIKALEFRGAYTKTTNPETGAEVLTSVSLVTYPYDCLNGQIPPWLDCIWVKADLYADVTYDQYALKADGEASSVLMATNQKIRLTEQCLLCSVPSGLYKSLSSITFAEQEPTGLSAYLYNDWKDLHYHGSITITEQDCSGLVGMGQRLNISGGRSGWETMGALVTGVSWDVDSGTTEVSFGWPAHLSVGDWMSLFRLGKTRRVTINPATKGDSASAASTDVELGDTTPNTVREQNQFSQEAMLFVGANYSVNISGTDGAVQLFRNNLMIADMNQSQITAGKCARFIDTVACVRYDDGSIEQKNVKLFGWVE